MPKFQILAYAQAQLFNYMCKTLFSFDQYLICYTLMYASSGRNISHQLSFQKKSHEHMIDYEFTNNNHDPLFETFLNDINCFNFLRRNSKIYLCYVNTKGYYAMSQMHQHISPLSQRKFYTFVVNIICEFLYWYHCSQSNTLHKKCTCSTTTRLEQLDYFDCTYIVKSTRLRMRTCQEEPAKKEIKGM